jgi:predicted transcriptional regulator
MKKEETKELILKALNNNGGEIQTSCKLAYLIGKTQGGSLCSAINELVNEGKIEIQKEGRKDTYVLVGGAIPPTEAEVNQPAEVEQKQSLETKIIEALKNKGGSIKTMKRLAKIINENYLDVTNTAFDMSHQGIIKLDKVGLSYIITLDKPQQEKEASIKPSAEEKPKAQKVTRFTIMAKLEELTADV